MCGASTFTRFHKFLNEHGYTTYRDFMVEDSYNFRPTNVVPVALNDEPKVVRPAVWGITPKWAKDGKVPLLFNTRDDSLIEKPYFRRMMQKHRCLIFADGFYEWAKVGKEKLPYYFHLKNNDHFAFAGIWDKSSDDDKPHVSIITTTPNQLVGKVHNRMPVILTLDHAQDWVQYTEESKLIDLIKPLPAKLMESYRVSKEVNYSSNQGPGLINSI